MNMNIMSHNLHKKQSVNFFENFYYLSNKVNRIQILVWRIEIF